MTGTAEGRTPLGLDLSGVTLRVAGLTAEMERRLQDDWAAFTVTPMPDPWLDIQIEFAERVYSEVVYRPKSMRSTLSAEAAHFGMPEGEASVAASGRAHFSLVSGLGDVGYFTVLNLMRACLAWVLPGRGGGLLHAAGLAVGDRAFLLVGAEGAGKSTWAGLGEQAGCRVLSDDLVLVLGSADSGHHVLGAPFRSTHAARYGPGRWPLAAILFPRHGDVPALNAVPGLLSQARLIANLPFIAEGIEDDERISRLVRRLSFEVPCAELTFARDPAFVELLRSWRSPE